MAAGRPLMQTPALIRKKREGFALSKQEIYEFVEGYTRGEIPDYQASALLMAIFFRGMDVQETVDLTEAMVLSGRVLDLSGLSQPKVDKHSTGGVGDKTSLIVAPAAAAVGLAVPMISGRGLGHTGGTLDKLESIPGFNTRLTLAEFRRVLATCGLGLIGQTDDLAPADRKLYALRDVTATVESLPLICASILSKKLAEGIDALVLDVKTGSGAFMKTIEDSRALGRRMVAIGTACGKRISALITDMNQPLGRTIGNALEVIECLEALKGQGPPDLMEVSRALASHMFVLGGVEGTLEDARARFDSVISSGKAQDKFAQCIAEQGGDPRVVEDYSRMPAAVHLESVVAPRDGYVAALEAETLGLAAVTLGAGRDRLDSIVDPAVGLVLEKKIGDEVRAGERICVVHYNERSCLTKAVESIRSAITISGKPVTTPLVVRETILSEA
jgi:pyrimidine-nucleoside phosphorylase